MSFTAEVKDELARVAPVCTHCERATLAALVRIEGTLLFSGQGKYRIAISTDVLSIASLAVKLLKQLYGLTTTSTVRRSVLHKTPNYLIEVPTQENLNDALVDMGILTETGGLEMGIKPRLIEKQCCTAAYVRGAFLGSGFIADPKGDFHFEISVESSQLAEDIKNIFENKGICARCIPRRNAYVVYLKSGSSIVDFLAFTGAHHAALDLENQRIIKSLRNDANRITNAEVANQAKTASAAIDQIFAIRKVIEAYGFDSLSPGLQEFIRLRVKHPEASLKEIGEFANPPLSKSAVYHRVRRIEQMAAQISE